MKRGPLGWFAAKVLAWAFGDRWPHIDPLTINPDAFDRIDRALRSQLNELASPDFHLLAREIMEAPDAAVRQMAVGRLFAFQMNELKIARVTAYILGRTGRDACHERDTSTETHIDAIENALPVFCSTNVDGPDAGGRS
jgi:hypothetical protein